MTCIYVLKPIVQHLHMYIKPIQYELSASA